MRKEQNKNYIQFNNKYGFLAISSLIIFGLVAWMVNHDFSLFIELETSISHLFQQTFGNPTMSYSSGILNGLMTFLASYGGATPLVILTCLIAVFFFIKRYNFLAFWLLGVVSTGGIIGILLKRIFHRTRPIDHLPLDNGFSFPSGHAIVSTLFFLTILLVFLPKIKNDMTRISLSGLTYLVWIGILFSRLYFHAHHLGDIIAGVSFSTFWVTTAILIYYFSADWFYKYFSKSNN